MKYERVYQLILTRWREAYEPATVIVSLEVLEKGKWSVLNVYGGTNDFDELSFDYPYVDAYEDYNLIGVYDVDALVELANEAIFNTSDAVRDLIRGYHSNLFETKAYQGVKHGKK